VSGIVIHHQFFLSPDITNKMCLECTFLDNLGDAHQTFQKYLFTSGCISAYLIRSKSNVVVCELEDSPIEGYESFGFSLSQSQQTVQYSQPNMQYLSQSDQMGYGIVLGFWIVGVIVNLCRSCSFLELAQSEKSHIQSHSPPARYPSKNTIT
jgi:hypothetical protein